MRKAEGEFVLPPLISEVINSRRAAVSIGSSCTHHIQMCVSRMIT
jgi:hypothetical protein